ncbi:MAG: hypothetical protein OXH32_08370 [Acidobacteria bacterium]|nr:hypothetical protein [Acidobacteriota bacterium]MXZ36960.1 hypothetical protein [Holophagales bacterium]
MAGEELRVGIRLTADGRDFVGAVREAARELDKLSRAAKNAGGVANGFAAANRKMSDTLRVAKDAAIAHVTVQALLNVQTKKFSGAAAGAIQRASVLTVALRAGSGAAVAFGTAMRGATVAARGFKTALAFLTGPGGLILLGVSAIFEMVTANKSLKESTAGLPQGFDDWGASIEDTAEKMRDLTAAQREVARYQLKDELKAARKEADKARGVLSRREGRSGSGIRSRASGRSITEAQAAVDTAEQKVSDLEQRLANHFVALAQADRTPNGTDLDPEALDRAFDAEIARLDRTNAEREQRKTDAAAALLQIEEDLQTDRERVIAQFEQRIAAIEHPDAEADDARKKELRERAEAAKQSALAEIEAAEAAERADKERASGIAALEALKQRQAALVGATDASTEALERETRAREIREQARALYKEATPEVIEQIVTETLATEDLEESIRKQNEVRKERFQQQVQQLEPLPDVTNDTVTEQDSDALKGYATGVDQVAASVEKYHDATTGAVRAVSFLDAVKAGTEGLAAHNRKAFRLNQAAAIAQAVIATHSAIAAVLGDNTLQPTPIRFVFAGLMAAAGAAQIAAIRAQKPPQAYAYGGIVDSPTFFSHRGGLGLAGEAGPEAILPLRRLSSGRLGVEAVGGRGDVIFSPSIHVTVETPAGGDAHGFGSEVGLRIRRELEPLIRDVMVNERRPGGVLNPTDRVHAY